MTELTMDQELRLIELEIKNLELLYKTYPVDNDPLTQMSSPRQYYINVAHTESRKLLDDFRKKWSL